MLVVVYYSRQTQIGDLIRPHGYNFNKAVVVKIGFLRTSSIKITIEKVIYITRNLGALRLAPNGLKVKKRRRFP